MLYPGQCATQTTLLRPARLPAPPVIQTQLNWGPFRVSVGHEKDARTDRINAAVTVVFSAPPLRRRELFSRPLTLPTLSTRVPRVEIALKAQVVPEVEITPDPLVLGPDPASGESRFSVRTRQPSRIVRAVGKSAHGAKVVELTRAARRIRNGTLPTIFWCVILPWPAPGRSMSSWKFNAGRAKLRLAQPPHK